MESGFAALGASSLSHLTTRETPEGTLLKFSHCTLMGAGDAKIKNNSFIRQVLVTWTFKDEYNGDEERLLQKETCYRENSTRKDNMKVCVWWG